MIRCSKKFVGWQVGSNMVVRLGTPTTRKSASRVSAAESAAHYTVDEYHEMLAAGQFNDNEAVELLDGAVVPKMPKSPRHRYVTRLSRMRLEMLLPPGYFVESQDPFSSATSEPEPDVTVVRGTPADFKARHPRPEEIAMLAEVSETTLVRDRVLKRRIYANDEVKIYWIVNLVDNQIEVLSDPQGKGDARDYSQRTVYGLDAEIPVVIDGVQLGVIAVRELLA